MEVINRYPEVDLHSQLEDAWIRWKETGYFNLSLERGFLSNSDWEFVRS